MKKLVIISSVLYTLCNLAYAADCSNIGSAKELSSICKAGQKDSCTLDATYKITESTGSLNSLLPPITITSNGALCIMNNTQSPKPIDIYAQSFFINGGTFQIGKATDPITSENKVTIYMGGSKSDSPAPQPLCASDTSKCSAIAKKSVVSNNVRDITVTNGGKLLMYGAKGLTPVTGSQNNYIHSVDYDKKEVDGLPLNKQNPGKSGDINQFAYFNNLTGSNSWTYLNMPAGPSYFNASDLNIQEPVVDYSMIKSSIPELSNITEEDTPYILVLARQVKTGHITDWQSGDWISIATTSFVSHETEIVQVCQIYDLEKPVSIFPPHVIQDYSNAIGTSKVSVIILAGSPNVKSKCKSLTNDTPLKHYHFGSEMPTPGFFAQDTTYTNSSGQTFQAKKGQAYSFYDSYKKNFGIDERAEVALLSRNIKLTSLAGQSSGSPVTNIKDQYFGGNIAVMNHNHESGQPPLEQLVLVGVEIEKFGQPLVGRYPIHLHRLNSYSTSIDPNAILVQDSSVHHSFNKCYVTHDTMAARFYNNSCVRTIGQGFYLEDGHNIASNQYLRNHVAGVMAAALNYNPEQKNVTNMTGDVVGLNRFWDGDYLAQTGQFNYNPAKIPDTSDSGANTGNYMDSFGPSGFWITTFGGYTTESLPNLFVNNSVAGCQLRGAAYWLVRQDVNDIKEVPSTVQEDLYPVFIGNRGHACYDGVMAGTNFAIVKAGKGIQPPASPPKPVAPYKNSANLGNAPLVVFDSLTLTQIQQKAFWYRGVFVALTNGRFGALKQGMTLLGGGGPEGNLLGFWGLVNNSVFAAVTNNNVTRYVDCNNNFYNYGTKAKTFSKDQALTVHKQNELAQCVPVDPKAVSLSPVSGIDNNISVFGDIYPNFNFQGYTFYDGPARMEDNRFVNFRADATNSTPLESIGGQTTRYLVTLVDAHKMLDSTNVAQLANDYLPGGTNYSGYNGDVAFSWLKGNQQSVPPTQYALGNIWENTNFKHQVFTEIANLQPPLQDGDKQTVEIDKDMTLSGYKICTATDTSKCSNNTNLYHYPISLNNLDIFSTSSTIDEPHARGRNNVAASALMSPHQYATVNVGVADQSKLAGLKITRSMKVFGDYPSTELTGRGGLKYMYEMMVMNNMGYDYSDPQGQYIGHNQLLFSYSDAPVHTTFINRVGICIGPDSSNVKIYKVPRQWNSGVNYLQPSPYFSGYGITSTLTSCPSVVTDINAYQDCLATAKTLNTNGWGEISVYANATDLNNAFLTGLEKNYNLEKTKPKDIKEGYYFDKQSGMLYFNMIQYPQQTQYAQAVTPPYGTCDQQNYSTNQQYITNYLAFSDIDNIANVIDIGCYASTGTPETSELLTCPKEGCAVYTVEFTKGSQSSCTIPSFDQIQEGNKPKMVNTNQVQYAPPYYLYDQSNTQLAPTSYDLTAVGNKGIKVKRDFNYDNTTHSMPGGDALIPLSDPVYVTGVHQVTLGQKAPPTDLTPWTLATGAVTAEISGADFAGPAPKYKSSSSISVPETNSSGLFYISGQYPHNVTVSINSGTYTCQMTLQSGGSVDLSSCSDSFKSHFTVNPPPSSGAPTTLTAH